MRKRRLLPLDLQSQAGWSQRLRLGLLWKCSESCQRAPNAQDMRDYLEIIAWKHALIFVVFDTAPAFRCRHYNHYCTLREGDFVYKEVVSDSVQSITGASNTYRHQWPYNQIKPLQGRSCSRCRVWVCRRCRFIVFSAWSQRKFGKRQ